LIIRAPNINSDKVALTS